MFQLHSGICGGERPVHSFGTVVSISFPCCDFGLHGCHLSDPAIETLPFEYAQFDLCDIEPTAVLGRVVNIQSLGQPHGFFRLESFI